MNLTMEAHPRLVCGSVFKNDPRTNAHRRKASTQTGAVTGGLVTGGKVK